MPNKPGESASIRILLPSAGMELCRWYITAGLLFMIPGRGAVPLLQSGFALLSSMLLAMLIRRLKIRRIAELTAHFLGFAVFFCIILKAYDALPFSSSENLPGFLESCSQIATPQEWFSLYLILAWTLLIWLRGRYLGTRDADYSKTIARFDVGVMFIFAVYFLRMGIHIEDPNALASVSAYLIFGILSIHAARNRDRDQTFIHSSSVTGLILLFTTGFILAGTAAIALYPAMTHTADAAYSLMIKGVKPLEPLIIAILRFLFGIHATVPAGSSNAGPTSQDILPGPPQEPAFWMQVFEKVLVYSLMAVLAISALLIAGYFLWRLIIHLSSHVENENEGLSFREFLRLLIRNLRARARTLFRFIRRIPGLVIRFSSSSGIAAAAFRRLTRWGRLSGIRRNPNETAREYAHRLAEGFPAVSPAILTILQYAEAETYGEQDLSAEETRELRLARRRIGIFRLLPARMLQRTGWRRINRFR